MLGTQGPLAPPARLPVLWNLIVLGPRALWRRGGVLWPCCPSGGGDHLRLPQRIVFVPGSSWLFVGEWAMRSWTLCAPLTTGIFWVLIFIVLVTCHPAGSWRVGSAKPLRPRAV